MVIGGLLALSSAAPLPAQAQRDHSGYTADFWGTDRGLPGETVTAITQASTDFIWVGTERGLARFDGLRFRTFRHKDVPALQSDLITKLCEDRSGRLWIGTERGLTCLFQGRFQALEFVNDAVTALSVDAAGALWIGTRASGLFRVRDGGHESFASHPLLANRSINALAADHAGNVWIGLGLRAGIVRFHDGAFSPVASDHEFAGDITALVEFPRGTMRVATTLGLISVQGGRVVQSSSLAAGVTGQLAALYVDPDDSLWIGGDALHRVFNADVAGAEQVAPTRVAGIAAMCKDREGNLWAASKNEGLIRIREPKYRQFSFGARNNDNGIRTVAQAPDGSVLIAQGALGITRIDPQGRKSSLPARSAADVDQVLAVHVARDGTQYTGTRGELLITRDGVTTSYPEVGGARAIFEDRRGIIWLGFQYAGLMQWRDGRFSRVALPAALADCTPQTLSETAHGDVYVGTWKHNLLRFSPAGGVTVYDQAAGAPGGDLRNVFVDRRDQVWVGSKGSGLGLLDGDRLVFPPWTIDVFDPDIHGLAEDDAGNLWLSTPRAIFMTPASELVRAIRGDLPISRLTLVNVTEGTGYIVSDLQCFPHVLNDRDGRIWFATKNRAVVVDPRTVRPNPVPPTVHIERVLANGRPLPLDASGAIELAAGTRELLIEYAGLSFSAPNRVRFQHRLEGFDNDWVPGEWRFAYYTNLHPGKYRFQVIAGNSDGIWNNDGASVAFVQEPHFYETWWAWALAVVVLGAGTAGIYRWRVAALERDKRRLEARITERTQELRVAKEQAEAATQAKTEFLESISHEIRNPLNGIVGLVAMLRETPRDEEEHNLARSLGACAKSLSRVFDEVLNFSRLEHGHIAVHEGPFVLSELVEDVVALFQVTARERGGDLVVHRDGEAADHFIGDEEKLGTILGNFISNAIKHAPGTRIDVGVQCDAVNAFGGNVTLTVTDHGPGIPATEQELIFGKFARGTRAKQQRAPGTGLGLATCRALAELLGGHVLVESEPGHGASFIVTLRLKRDRSPRPAADATPATIATPTEHALVVEDQAYNQIVVRRVAEKLGFAVEVARTAGEAREKFEQRTFSVVLLDWELPDANGDEVARYIRRHPAGRDVILIATTAHDHDDIRRQGTAAGIDDFALKPLELSTMARLIAAVRAQRSASHAGRPAHLDTRVFRLVGRNDPRGSDAAAEHYGEILDREIASLTESLVGRDFAAAGKIAHRIKAHAGLVDAAELRATADQLHRLAQAGATEQLPALQRKLVAQAAALRERLNRWRRPAAVG